MKTLEDFNVLALDTSTPILRLALRFGGDRLVKAREEAEQSHGQVLLKRIGELVTSAGLSVHQLDAIAVSTGPGSFTGLRIGLAAAKGIAVALGIPIVPVSAFELAAARLRGEDEPVHVVIPLNRDECILCLIDCGAVGEPEVVRYRELPELVGSAAFAGIAVDLQTQLPGLPNRDLSDRLDYDASDLVPLALEKLAEHPEGADVMALEPLYLQKSQAEIRFERQQKRG